MGEMLCELCQSEEAHNFHHLIPRSLHSNKWFKKRFTREQMQTGVQVCKLCHRAIHTLVPERKQLGREFNTLETLLAHEPIARHVEWKQRGNSEDQG